MVITLKNLLVVSVLFTSCSCNKPAISAAHFQVPDSVKPYPVISVFDEGSVSCISILAPGNKSHLQPRRITYFVNGEVVTEPLKALPDGRYESSDGKSEYIVENNSVRANYCPVRGQNMDANLVYTWKSE